MNANLMTKKIEMSKKEAKAAGKIGTPEFEELKNYMAMYPGFEVQIKAPAKRKVEFRGLTYEYMRDYIILHTAPEDELEAVAEFDELILISKCQAKGKRYPTIKKWFLAKFPEIKQYKEQHAEKVQKILAAA